MVIVEPIPGQEDRNSDFLLENGCGIKANNLAAIGPKLQSLLSDPRRLLSMRSAAASQGRPTAALDVARQCANLLHISAGEYLIYRYNFIAGALNLVHVFFIVYVFVTAFAFARLEIQIEGPHGGAANRLLGEFAIGGPICFMALTRSRAITSGCSFLFF
jgi:hypothetical protein